MYYGNDFNIEAFFLYTKKFSEDSNNTKDGWSVKKGIQTQQKKSRIVVENEDTHTHTLDKKQHSARTHKENSTQQAYPKYTLNYPTIMCWMMKLTDSNWNSLFCKKLVLQTKKKLENNFRKCFLAFFPREIQQFLRLDGFF